MSRSRPVPFTKMHGLGNDYVYVDARAVPLGAGAARELARRVSPRRTGVGSDGLILIGPSDVADCRMTMFNADGSRGAMCGNGARCVARFVYDRWTGKSPVTIETDAGIRTAEILLAADGAFRAVRLDMGAPKFAPADVPVDAPERLLDAPLPVPGCGTSLRPRVTAVSMGNPHAVLFVEDVATAPVTTLGPEIERHAAFPQGANVEFVRVVDPERLEMRVWERGSGETAACGTGACAALVAAAETGRARRRATVAMPGGPVEVAWEADGRVFLTGPADYAFEGVWPAGA